MEYPIRRPRGPNLYLAPLCWRRWSAAATSFAFVTWLAGSWGCGEDASSASGGNSGTAASRGSSCADACAQLADVCGNAPPGCDDACATWSDTARDCIGEALDCPAASSCVESTSSDGGAGTSGPGGGGRGDPSCVELQQQGCVTPNDCCIAASCNEGVCCLPAGIACASPGDCCAGSSCVVVPGQSQTYCN